MIENLKTFILAAASLICGGIGASRLPGGGWLTAVLLHLASAALGWRAAVVSDKRRLGGHSFQLFVSFCIPFFGGVIAFLLSESIKLGQAGALAESFSVYLSSSATFRESVPIREGKLPESGNLVSLADILAAPVSESEQRIAVEYLASMETPAAIEILRRVVESDSGDARFFAMTAIGQLEEKLLTKIQRMEEDIKSKRESGCKTQIDAARSYIDFSYYQLAQESMRHDYLERAGGLLESALKDEDCEAEVWVLLGRVKLLEFNAERALACFNTYLETHPGDVGCLLWRAEAWFMLGDHANARKDCQAAAATGTVPDNIRGAVDFWLAGADVKSA